MGHDHVEEALACIRGELFGVIDPLDTQTRGQDYRCGNNRPGQRASAGFIYAGDQLESVIEGLPLEKEQVNRRSAEEFGLNHVLYPGPEKQDKCVNEVIFVCKTPKITSNLLKEKAPLSGAFLVLHSFDVLALADTGCLAAQFAQVVKLGAADVSSGYDFNFLKDG